MLRKPLHASAAVVILGVSLAAPAAAQDCSFRPIPEGGRDSSEFWSIVRDNMRCAELRSMRQEREIAALKDRVERLSTAAESRLIEPKPGLASAGVVQSVTALGPDLAAVTFRLQALPGRGPVETTLDADVIHERCADAAGCLVTIGARGLSAEPGPGGMPFRGVLWRGPCLLHIDVETGDWMLSGECPARAATEEQTTGDDLAPAPAGTAWGWGTSASGGPSAMRSDAPEPRVIMEAGGTCLLADGALALQPSAPASAPLRRDDPRHFHLIAGTQDEDRITGIPARGGRRTDPLECWVTVRD
jgi:hypothetical protein